MNDFPAIRPHMQAEGFCRGMICAGIALHRIDKPEKIRCMKDWIVPEQTIWLGNRIEGAGAVRMD